MEPARLRCGRGGGNIGGPKPFDRGVGPFATTA